MMVNVDSLINKEKDYIDFSLSDDISSIEFLGTDYSLVSPVNISGRISKAGRNFRIKSEVSFLLQTDCSRCLVDLKYPIDYSIDAYLMREEYDEDEYEDVDVFGISSSNIDLLEIVNSTLSFNMPQKILCSEECKGICSVCGVDLNIKSCECEDSIDVDDIDPRFAKLKELLK